MNLMIVDDNYAMRKMLREFCSPYFEKVEECSNGMEAIKKYEISLPDFIIMDIKMPIMNGIEALKRITGLHPEAKIIMITQYKDEELETESIKAGAYRFLLKENLTELGKILIKN